MTPSPSALREALETIASLYDYEASCGDLASRLYEARNIARAALAAQPEQAAPSAPAPLTDEIIHRLWLNHGPRTVGGQMKGSIIEFAHAVRAHGIVSPSSQEAGE
jgi:hypothetical protein